MASITKRYRISQLPLASSSLLPTHNLTPDPITPSVAAFRALLGERPSVQRRARLLSPEAHFSYVTPFVVSGGFPYRITFEGVDEDDQPRHVENWLAEREPSVTNDAGGRLQYPKGREEADLIGLSENALRDCLPHLDVGDAFGEHVLGVPALVTSSDDTDIAGAGEKNQEAAAARKELIDVLSARAVIISDNEEGEGLAPWSMRYSGHQFGSWAGQLGDGRAISIWTTPHPSSPSSSYELQLKGAGRTPFSRSADGLAVLRSSIREYLCSEAMQALGIPTTRALALVHLPAIPVSREKLETASIVTRLAPSFVRIGCFEAVSPPDLGGMFFFGGGQQKSDWEALRVLGEWVEKLLWPTEDARSGAWGERIVFEVARRNARMVAAWQAYGFMHGVINTDNVSILGLTIDYGPYAFMDVFDRLHICNHSDEGGRYSYAHQPNMIVYALKALLNALSPLIGAEAEAASGTGSQYSRVAECWAASSDEEKIKEWREQGKALVQDEMERIIQEETSIEYGRLMRKRLGLRRQDRTDETELFRPLLDNLQDHRLDFHSTFRKLCYFRPSLLNDEQRRIQFIHELLEYSPEPEMMDRMKAQKDWETWMAKFSERISNEKDQWEASGENLDQAREDEALSANPRFVLRQWVLEEIIAKVEKDPASGKRVLAKALHMASHPFEPWGGENKHAEDLDDETKEERRFCGTGEKKMLGFQCSCSS